MTDDARSLNIDITASSGNVFADLGFAEPGLELAKAKLAAAISQIIESRELTQADAGQIAGLDQPRISAIMRGRLGGFTIDRLFRTLNALGQDIEVTVRSSNGTRAAHLTITIESARPG